MPPIKKDPKKEPTIEELLARESAIYVRENQPPPLLKDDPDIIKFNKIVTGIFNVFAEKSIINRICEFNPKSLNTAEAESLHQVSEKLKAAVKVIQARIDVLSKLETQDNKTRLKRLELQKMGTMLWDIANNWIDKKYNEYLALKVQDDKQHEKKLAAFKKIYKALYEGESGIKFLKENFMAGRENYTTEQLDADLKKYNSERIQSALTLAEKYKDNCTWENNNLFTEIYKYSFKHSGIFSKSGIMGITIYSSKTIAKYSLIEARAAYIEAHPGSRTAKICQALGYQKPAKNMSNKPAKLV